MVLSNKSNDFYDVVVVGGGPGGSALATFCQRHGHSCLVLERSTFPRYHIGESLIPHTYGTLDRLGLLPALKASHFPKKYSVRFVSESGSHSDPFYFSETIPGPRSQTWQVERSEFDQMCLEHARQNGVKVQVGVKVDRVIFENDQAVAVRVRSADGPDQQIGARVVVDASGRATFIGTQLGLKGPVPGLDKASIWTYFRGGERLEGIDAGETTVFMIRNRGWFWYIPLPEDVVSVGVVASPDDLFRHSQATEAVFAREVDACEPLKQRLRKAERIAPVRGIPQLAYRNGRIAGDGWVMIGDAAAFLDPIYSSGLFLALVSAELAAGCVHEALVADDVSGERLGAFGEPLMQGVDVIRRLIHAFYDPQFSFRKFAKRFPEHRAALIDCLVGDVIHKDMNSFTEALAQMTAPPPPLPVT